MVYPNYLFGWGKEKIAAQSSSICLLVLYYDHFVPKKVEEKRKTKEDKRTKVPFVLVFKS